MQGWNVKIQSLLHYVFSAYNSTFLQMFLISVVLNILGIAAMTMITLFVSAKLNTPVTALITSCAVCFLPVPFDFTQSVPLLQKLQEAQFLDKEHNKGTQNYGISMCWLCCPQSCVQTFQCISYVSVNSNLTLLDFWRAIRLGKADTDIFSFLTMYLT